MTQRRNIKPEIRSLDEADETRDFPRGRSDVARFSHRSVSRSTPGPAWTWSLDVGAAMGLEWCPPPDLGYVIGGAIAGRQQDGTDLHYGAGDAFALEPGHDVWVVGDETYTSIDVVRAAPLGPSVVADVLGRIGSTPLVLLKRVVSPGMARVMVKVEGVNPRDSGRAL